MTPLLLVILSLRIAIGVDGEGFVEEVSCSSDSMTIILNKTDPDIQRWTSTNSDAQPIAYVYGAKNRTPCGISLKQKVANTSNSSSGNPKRDSNESRINYNLTIAYGPNCNLFLVDVEPNFLTAETTIAIEDNQLQDLAKPLRINHVFCLYTSEVQALKINDVSNGHQVIASTGGKPKPKVQMLFRNPDGTPLKTAKFGDAVSLYLMLSADSAYKAISPKHCMFSDRDDMKTSGARTLTFVQSNCPVPELGEIIQPLQDLNEEVYYTQFQAFRFGQQTTVYAHCTVEVCLNAEKCEKQCYHRLVNSSLLEQQKRLKRHSGSLSIPRDAPGEDPFDAANAERKAQKEEIAISNQIVVLDEDKASKPKQEATGEVKLSCPPNLSDASVVRSSTVSTVLIPVVLAALLLLSLLAIACLKRRLAAEKQELASIVNSNATTTVDNPACIRAYKGQTGGCNQAKPYRSDSLDKASLARLHFKPDHQIPRLSYKY